MYIVAHKLHRIHAVDHIGNLSHDVPEQSRIIYSKRDSLLAYIQIWQDVDYVTDYTKETKYGHCTHDHRISRTRLPIHRHCKVRLGT